MANPVPEPDTLTAISNRFVYAVCVALIPACTDRSARRNLASTICHGHATVANLYTCTGDADETAIPNCDTSASSQPGHVDGPLACNNGQPCGGGAG